VRGSTRVETGFTAADTATAMPEVVVVGGGVTGLGVARDLALRGVDVRLVERARDLAPSRWPDVRRGERVADAVVAST